MTSISKSIKVGIDEFTNEELFLEVERRGYNILENSSSYDLSLVDDTDLINALNSNGYVVMFDSGFFSADVGEYILDILPEVKIGSEEYFHQQTIRDFFRGAKWTA